MPVSRRMSVIPLLPRVVGEVPEHPLPVAAAPERLADVHPLELAVRLVVLVTHEQDAAAPGRDAVVAEHEEVDVEVDEPLDREAVAALGRVARGEVRLELLDEGARVGLVRALGADRDGHRVPAQRPERWRPTVRTTCSII